MITAIPELTHCSAHTPPPVPIDQNKMPENAAPFHCFMVGFSPLNKELNTYKIKPATKNRQPAIKKGGMS